MLEIGLQPRLALGAFRRDLRPLGSALRHLFEPRARRRVAFRDQGQPFENPLPGAALVGFIREQIERQLLVFGRDGAAAAQFRLVGGQFGFVFAEFAAHLFGLLLHFEAAFARFAFLADHFLEAFTHPCRFGGGFLGVAPQPRRSLLEQHDLVLGLDARFLTVTQAALGDLEFAFEFEQRELAIIEIGFERRELRRNALTACGLFLPAIGRFGLGALELEDAAAGEAQVQIANAITQPLVLAGSADLPRQRAHLALDLEHNVVQARQVAFGGLKLVERFLLARLVLGDSRSLLEQEAAVSRIVAEHVVDHAAFDHRVGVAAHSGVGQQVADVLQAARLLVQEILRHAGAEDLARHQHFVELGGQDAAIVAEGDVHFRHADGLARRAAIEDDIFHRAAAELLGALLAQHPADRIGDVGLATAVRTDHAGHAAAEFHQRTVDKRLESLDFELLEEHPCSPSNSGAHEANRIGSPRDGARRVLMNSVMSVI